MHRRDAIKVLSFAIGGAATIIIDDATTVEAVDGFDASFDFDASTFTGTITEPDGTINNLSGYHGVGELPPLGGVPCQPAGSTADVVLSGVVDHPQGFTVPAGEVWELNPTIDTTITVAANIVVNGTLRALPNPGVKHTIRFVSINEAAIVGGHAMAPVASDVGLWVDGGVLDISGTPKVAWNRTGSDPSWSATDELIVAPTDPGKYTATPFAAGSPVPTVSTSTLHPNTSHQISRTYAAEVINLTRNVAIEAIGGRAHIMFINCDEPQRLSYTSIANLGPTGKMGRYPLHVHMCGDGVDGSDFRGNVARGCGNHAFVTHMSHGCDHSDSIAYRTLDSAFWWDDNTETNRVRWDRCGAIETMWTTRGSGASGFVLGEGVGNSCVESFATGTTSYVGGFRWPATANQNEHNVWGAFNCVAHNNNTSGVFVWQNDTNPHSVIGFVSYRNNGAGFNHGAYMNRYRYFRCVGFGNTGGDFVAHALGDWGVSGCWLEVFKITKHTLPGGAQLVESSRDWPVVSVVIDESINGGTVGGSFRFISGHFRCDLPASRVEVDSLLSTVEFVNKGESFTLTP